MNRGSSAGGAAGRAGPKPHGRGLVEAFRAAGCGLQHALHTQRNLRVQCGLAAVALGAGLVLRVPGTEMAVLVLACGLVLGLELVNTGVEALVDGLWPHPSEVARRVKDTAAAAVVVAAACAAGAGVLILGPTLLVRLGVSGSWLPAAVAGLGVLAASAGAGWRWRAGSPPVEAPPPGVVKSGPRGR